MRLSTLLDTVNNGGSGPWPPYESSTISAAEERRQFDRVIADLMPCRAGDPELWFAEQYAQVEQAKALCHQCPLMAGCLAGAIDRGEPWGVWGGEVFVDGVVVPVKRGRGRPRKSQSPAA